MAAVVCKGCMNCCESCCSGLGKCMDSCCNGCADCCNHCCDALCGRDRPLPLCICFTLIVNFLPMFLFVLFAILMWSNDCGVPLQSFLLLEGILCFLNTLFSFYIYWRFSLKDELKENALQRSARILCYDPVVCVFFLIWAFEFAWQIVGIFWIDRSHCISDSDDLDSISILAIIIMFIYLVLGGMTALCSVCCNCVSILFSRGDSSS